MKLRHLFLLVAAVTLAHADPVPTRLDRVAIIGASVSSGFMTPARVSDWFKTALPKSEIADYADVFTSQDPDTIGERAVKKSIEFKPTLVVAIDFLFWYAYGRGGSESQVSSIKHALDLLDGLLKDTSCVLVIGDLPNMAGAREFMLPARAIPSARQLAELNEIVRHWARDRKDIVVLPLAEWHAALRATTSEKPMIAFDRLHLTQDGLHELLDKMAGVLETEHVIQPKELVFR